MLRTKALRKIFLTTLTLFVLLTVFTITNSKTENVLKTNLEIEDIAGFKTDVIYLLNDKGLLVKTKILLEGNTDEEKINIHSIKEKCIIKSSLYYKMTLCHCPIEVPLLLIHLLLYTSTTKMEDTSHN